MKKTIPDKKPPEVNKKELISFRPSTSAETNRFPTNISKSIDSISLMTISIKPNINAPTKPYKNELITKSKMIEIILNDISTGKRKTFLIIMNNFEFIVLLIM